MKDTVLICVTFLLSLATAQTTLRAEYNMGGVTGKITFTQPAVGRDVTIVLTLNGLQNDRYTLELHEFRVNYDTINRCSIENIGNVTKSIGAADVSSGVGQLVVGGMDLSGTKSIEGRSFVVANQGSLRICATIEADADYITAFAHLPAALGGTVIFRQQDNSPNADTFIYYDLYYVGESRPTTPISWQINSGIVKMDIDASTDVTNRCGSTIKDLYNPDSSSGISCSTENHSSCKIGDLSAKHGNLTVPTSGKSKGFFGDLKLPLSGANSIIDKTLAFLVGDNYFACANIVQYPKMGAVAKFSNDNVTGNIMFNQRSPLDPVLISVNLERLDSIGGGYHVHEWPVPQKIGQTETVCDSDDVGGHFNPFQVPVDSFYPPSAATTPEKYEVGDLSGKFGMLSNMSKYVKNMTDPNLQLYGKNSIIGRSLVIHKAVGGSRWICTSIWPAGDTPMITAYARFTYPVIGYMVLRQPKGKWFSETQIYAELNYGTSSTTRTLNHNWHVHASPMGNDMLNDTQRCQSVGPHYNPYSVQLSGNYTTECNPDNPFRCELGDLSGKHGKLNIRTDLGGMQRYFFTDMQLPLSGPQSIVGKSITIHDANAGAGRLSCADVKEKRTREVRVSKWSSANGQRSPTGTITFTQDCAERLSGVTKLTVSLTGLNSEVAGYHIHEFPTDVNTPQSQVCQSSDTGGHLNPFKASYPGPAVGSMDQYEIGDLSGKFDRMSGASYSTEVLDYTLPLEGPHSIVGRSVVLHKNDAVATRWACGNIEDVTPGSRLIEHRATFTGDIQGYVHLSQYHYDNGDTSNTFIVVKLEYSNDTKRITTGHNWHVHVSPISTDCASCGPHYNPYMVNMDSGVYKTECSMYNPLRCEVGDQAGKLGQYDIGSGKRFFSDPNLNLEGKMAAAKRSVVIHASNGAGDRIACANLIPYGKSAATFQLHFLRVDYTRADIETAVATSLSTQVDNVLVERKAETVDCTSVTVYFLGDNKETLMKSFTDIVNSGNDATLGKFAPNKKCNPVNNSVVPVTSMLTMLLGLVLTRVCAFRRR